MPEFLPIFDDLLLEGTRLLEQRDISKYAFQISDDEMKLRFLIPELRHFIVEIKNNNLHSDSQLYAVLSGNNIHLSVIDAQSLPPRYVGSVCAEYLPIPKKFKRFFLNTDAGFKVDEDISAKAIEAYKQMKCMA